MKWFYWEKLKKYELQDIIFKFYFIYFSVPRTRFFTTLHPKIISLSPGTTFTLPITFRPLDKIKYEDYIEVNQIDFQNTFRIPLTANLPEFKIDFINEQDLGSCAAGEFVQKQIRIKNLSELDTMFEWDFRSPFTITPMSGDLPAHSHMDVTIMFQPAVSLLSRILTIVKVILIMIIFLFASII